MPSERIRPAMLDFVARNRIRHPGWVAAGRYEVVGAALDIVLPLAPATSAAAARPVLGGDADTLSIAGDPLAIAGDDLTIGGAN